MFSLKHHCPLVVVVSLIRIHYSVISTEDRPGQGSFLYKMFSGDIAFADSEHIARHSDSYSHTQGCVCNLCFFVSWKLKCRLRLVTEYEEIIWRVSALFDSATHLVFHFIFITTLGDENFLKEETGQQRQSTLPKVRWLGSARDLRWTDGSTSLEEMP